MAREGPVEPLVDQLLLHLAVGKRCQVLCSLVALAVDGEDLAVAVRHDDRRNNDHDDHRNQHDQTAHRQRIAQQLAHTVAEEGGALAHHVLLLLFLVGRRRELAQVDLQVENAFLREIVFVFHMRSPFSVKLDPRIHHFVEQIADQIRNHH